jgi:hypothetical protein
VTEVVRQRRAFGDGGGSARRGSMTARFGGDGFGGGIGDGGFDSRAVV